MTKPTTVLRHRNYRLLWSGNAMSQFGDHMQVLAQNWLIWEITGSVRALGLAAFVVAFPRLLFGFFGGPIVDKYNRRRLLMFTQSVAFIFAATFTTMVYTNKINFQYALLFIFLLECTQSINANTRQSLVPEIIPRDDIPSAVSLNSVSGNMARIFGPALGGLLIPLIGVSGLMTINTFTFMIVVIALRLMTVQNINTRKKEKEVTTFKEDLVEGYIYIWNNRKLRVLLYLALVSAFLIMPFTSLLPAYVGSVLQMGPEYLGFLTASFGAGAVVGAFNGLTLRSRIGNIVTFLATIVQGLAFILFGFSSVFLYSSVIMFLVGLATMVYSNSVLTAIQLTASLDYLGRVLGIYSMHKAVTAMGALLLSFVASFTGIGYAFIIAGFIYLLFGAGTQLYYNDLIKDSISPAISKR